MRSFFSILTLLSSCVSDAVIEDDSVTLAEIGHHMSAQDFFTNAEIFVSVRFEDMIENSAHLQQVTPFITQDIQAVSVSDILSDSEGADYLQNTLIGAATMVKKRESSFQSFAMLFQVNRLLSENQILMQEIQALKTTGHTTRFDGLVFKKANITTLYTFQGCDGIAECVVNEIIELFDQTCTRRSDSAVNTIRRFVKFLLENVRIFFLYFGI